MSGPQLKRELPKVINVKRKFNSAKPPTDPLGGQVKRECHVLKQTEIDLSQPLKQQNRLTSVLLSDPDWIRTNDPQLRRLMLYPTELPDLGSPQN